MELHTVLFVGPAELGLFFLILLLVASGKYFYNALRKARHVKNSTKIEVITERSKDEENK